MDLKSIQEVVNSNQLVAEQKEALIINILASDEKVIPLMMKILSAERRESNELISDYNLELSRALVLIHDPNLGKKNRILEPKFVISEIKNHYLKWQHKIKCCFNINGLP